jgi:hypothetical protein
MGPRCSGGTEKADYISDFASNILLLCELSRRKYSLIPCLLLVTHAHMRQYTADFRHWFANCRAEEKHFCLAIVEIWGGGTTTITGFLTKSGWRRIGNNDPSSCFAMSGTEQAVVCYCLRKSKCMVYCNVSGSTQTTELYFNLKNLLLLVWCGEIFILVNFLFIGLQAAKLLI